MIHGSLHAACRNQSQAKNAAAGAVEKMTRMAAASMAVAALTSMSNKDGNEDNDEDHNIDNGVAHM